MNLTVPSEVLVATTTTQGNMKMPPIISLEGPDVEPSVWIICGIIAIPHRQSGYFGETVPEVVHLSNFRPRKTPRPSEF